MEMVVVQVQGNISHAGQRRKAHFTYKCVQ